MGYFQKLTGSSITPEEFLRGFVIDDSVVDALIFHATVLSGLLPKTDQADKFAFSQFRNVIHNSTEILKRQNPGLSDETTFYVEVAILDVIQSSVEDFKSTGPL